MGETITNRIYKDRLFKRIFTDKSDLLSLYNAVNGTAYDNPDEIEINTIEEFLYMGMKNDVSFLIADVLNLYEQQSTINPNMPLRGFLYFAKLYQKLFAQHKDLYSSRMIPLPLPQFIVFYNGTDEEPDRREMKLSDAFVGESRFDCSLECRAVLLNINYGHNKELMEKCRALKEYAILIYKIRDNIASGLEKEDAIDSAVDACIQEGILKGMLEKHRREAREMLLTEYDEELHIKNEKQISYEDGERIGFENGEKIGLENGKKAGLEKGIRIYIEDKAEDGMDVDAIIDRLLNRFELKKPEAEEYVRKYMLKKQKNEVGNYE